MKFSDYIELSFSNLWKMKLRTFLTTFGVIIGIGALVSMISFGSGMQKNVTESFKALELFNSITVFPGGYIASGQDPDEPRQRFEQEAHPSSAILDEKVVAEISKLKGVETVFPDVNFPAIVRFNGQEEFRLVQVVPARVASSKMIKLRAGKPYLSDDENSAIISNWLLRQLKIKDPSTAIGKKIELSSIAFDFAGFNPLNLASLLQGNKLPLSKENYEFTIVGVKEGMGFGGPSPVQNDLMIPAGAAQKIKKLPFTSIWDIFRAKEGKLGYSALNVRLSSPRYVESVKSKIKEMGFSTFALADQLEQIKTSFIYLDMILAAVGMIAIFVASLGIINTMVMSILERYAEIGIMKAVGASDGDVRKIFFFESSSIGFMGGILGFGLGWVVSRLINRIVNYFLARQGVPYIEYFNFPLWLFVGAVLFSVIVSLAAGIYPAHRAAKVDPVIALRHD
jgi:putative ABC transport system permease protein